MHNLFSLDTWYKLQASGKALLAKLLLQCRASVLTAVEDALAGNLLLDEAGSQCPPPA